MRRRASVGFTLVEVLVVLIIVGLISSILLQALSQIYKLQTRFGRQLAQSQEGEMMVDWYRQLIQGLQTDTPLGKDKFVGTALSLEGLSINPLSQAYGAPEKVLLKIAYDGKADATSLQYETGGRTSVLFSWPGKAASKFSYVDASGGHHERWPPLLGPWPQLPGAILLQVPSGVAAQVIVAVPRASNEAKRLRFPTAGPAP